MHRLAFSIIALLTVSYLSAAHAADRMSAAQVSKIIAGATVEGATSHGVGYRTVFAANGVITVETDGYGDDTGRWWITKDNYLCTQYERFYDGIERCIWFEATSKSPGFKAFIQGTNEPTFFNLKRK